MAEAPLDSWKPPASYPAILRSSEHRPGWYILHFPDFQLELMFEGDPVHHGAKAVRSWLKERTLKRQLPPFASDPMTLEGDVIIIPTDGWDNPVDLEEVPDD